MKKLIIGLLIVAAGTAAFFLLRKQSKPIAQNAFNQEWIVGSWKLDSLDYKRDSSRLQPHLLAVSDTNLAKYRYEFTKDNVVFISQGDSLKGDSARYVWNKNEIVFSNDSTASSRDSLTVIRLSTDSLVLRDHDSTGLFFTKVK